MFNDRGPCLTFYSSINALLLVRGPLQAVRPRPALQLRELRGPINTTVLMINFLLKPGKPTHSG